MIYILMVLLAVVGHPVARAASFDSSVLNGGSGKGKGEAAPAPEKRSAPVKTDRGRLKLEGESSATDKTGNPQDTIDKINAINTLIQNGSQGAALDTLLVNRASAINLYVRQVLLTSKTGRLDQRGKQLLEQSVKDGLRVAASQTAPPALRQKARRVVGFSYVYLDQPSMARDQFIQVLQENPRAENAGWLALYIAEDFFENGRYRDAVTYYRNFFNVMSEEQKALALYKIAWAFINLGQSEEARKIFVQLTARDNRVQTAKDSLRDLAYLVSSEANEATINKTIDEFKGHPDVQLEFLRLVQATLEAQNNRALHAKILARLLPLETDPEKHIRLLVSNLKLSRTQYASRAYLAAFVQLHRYIAAEKIKPKTPPLANNQALLEPELKSVMRAILDTYTGKAKSPDDLPKKYLGAMLVSQIDFYDYIYPVSDAIPALVKLKLDLTIDMMDWPKVDQVAERIQRDPKRFPDIQERAAIDQLAALTELAKNDKEGLWKKRRAGKLRYFIEKWPQSGQWIRIAKNYAELLIDSNDHANALPVLEKILAKEPVVDNLYRALFSKFKLEQFQEVLDDQREAKLPGGRKGGGDPRIAELKRESALTLALKAKEKEDFEGYAKNLKTFLASSPDPAKAAVARKDYYGYVIAKNRADTLTQELMALPPKTRGSKEYEGFLLSAWSSNMEKGNFKEAHQLVADVPSMEIRANLSKVALGHAVSPAELKKLPDDKRAYILGMLALTKPDQVLAYYNTKGSRPKTDADRDLAALALRIQTKEWGIKKTPENQKLLGWQFKFAEPEVYPEAAIEKHIASVKVPGAGSKFAKNPKFAERLFEDVRYVRKRVAKGVAGKAPPVQLRVFQAAQALEQATAQFILTSPIPTGLSPEQEVEYRTALQTASEEFTNQGQEFGTLAQKVEEAIKKAKEEYEGRTLPPADVSRWPWPPSFAVEPKLDGVKKARDQRNFLGALLLIDLLREDIMKDDVDYFTARAGLLLSLPPNDALRRYLWSELERSKRQDVLDIWKGLAK